MYDILIVPPSIPKTKPKACNYALQFARGEYLAIYDAEDRPERDQLKKAIACFKKSSPETVCLQSRLIFYNSNENWLTRMFTLEYALWFDFFLPALEYLKVPIPLGGTSNHFKTRVLNALGGWDPFNVTEDADLGIRFSRLGFKVKIINSTTYEEANTQLGNWIRQRSRWYKGYMQTYLVYMRSPLEFYRMIGPLGFFSFQFFIGGTFFSAIIVPFLYITFLFWSITKTTILVPYFPQIILIFCFLSLLIANPFFIYSNILGVFKRRYYRLIPYALTILPYWVLMSFAVYKGLWQLFINPFYWEKTKHGLSKVIQNENKRTLEAKSI